MAPDGRRAKTEHQGPGAHQESLIAALMLELNWSQKGKRSPEPSDPGVSD
jgi:hypothetical protein